MVTHKPLVGSPNLPLGTLKPALAGFFIIIYIQIDKLIHSRRRTIVLVIEHYGMDIFALQKQRNLGG